MVVSGHGCLSSRPARPCRRLDAYVSIALLLIVAVSGPVALHMAKFLRIAAYAVEEVERIASADAGLGPHAIFGKACRQSPESVPSEEAFTSSWGMPVTVRCEEGEVQFVYRIYDPICTRFLMALSARGIAYRVDGNVTTDPYALCPRAGSVWVELR